MKRRTGWALLCVAALVLFSLVLDFSPRATSQGRRLGEGKGPKAEGLENYDIRAGGSKKAWAANERRLGRLSPQQKAKQTAQIEDIEQAGARLTRSIPGAKVLRSELSGLPEVVTASARGKFLTERSAQSPEKVVRGFVSRNADLYGLSARQASRLKKTADYANPSGNLRWVVLEQEIGGIPVFQGTLVAALTKHGELVRTVSGFAAGIDDSAVNAQAGRKAGGKGKADEAVEFATSPTLSAAEAVAAAASTIGVSVNPADLAVKESSEDGNKVVFHPGPFADDVVAELQYFPHKAGEVSLAWGVVLWQETPAYYALVDAEDGELLWRKNMTNEQTQTATYSFYDDDSPAPLSPSTSVPGAPVQGAAIPRSTLTTIGEHPLGDPWMNDADNITTGNNVDSGMDLVSPNGIDAGSRAVGAPFRVFNFAYNPGPGIPPPGDAPTLANYRFGEAVNMFVWSNRYHDRLYALGFTESARNFQQNNFARGGVGNDRVLAEGQDFSGTNNANFSTFADGIPGRMQMYIFTGPTPDRTSGIDHEILIHELTHGTSNRLHANASGLATTMSGGMGEGWSDFYARALLSTAGEDVNGVYAAGGYATLAIVSGYVDNYYYGIRRFPYAVKTNLGPNGKPHNPLTFADIDPTQINLTDGAFPRGPIGSSAAFQVHNIGEVWCMSLLEMRARLITRQGHAVGNQQALQLVTDGMKLDSANPTLVEGRNSILAANCASGGTSADELDIWAGFATRGLGYSASAVSSSSSSVVEAFDLPNVTLGAITLSNDSCDLSGFADPGETVSLSVPLSNPFCATTLEGVTASITGGGSASYGDLAPGASGTQDITYTVPSGAACGSQIAVPIEISSSLGTITRTYTLQVGAPTSTGVTVTHGSGNVAVPINDLTTVEIPVVVTDTGFVGDVNVRVRLNHTFDGDLVLSLVAPDGTTVALSNNRGAGGDNFGTGSNDCAGTPTVFDDQAAATIASGTAPFANSFRPDAPLSGLNGKEMNGTWKLRVADVANLDTGSVGCVTLDITPQLYYCCGVAGTPIMQAAPPATVVAESASPANNAPDPDETVTMSFPLKNVGTGLTTNLVATLLPGGGVNAPSGPQSYGVLSPIGPSVARDYTFVASGNCGDFITATFQLQDGPLDLGTVSFVIRLGTTVATVAPPASNPTAMNFPVDTAASGDGVGPATPYPSTINVSGLTGTINKVTVTLTGVEHTFPSDIDVLLVGPQGQKMILMSDAGGGTDIANVNITFDDDAAAVLPATLVSGTFRPTNITAGDTFAAPAPGGPYGAALSVFDGTDPNGTWSLYALDDAALDDGSIAGGWSLTITTDVPVCVTSPCVLGVADITQANDPGSCGAFVTYAPTVTGSCGVVTSAPPSGSFFPVGTSPVVVTGTRQDSSTTVATFNVTVNDVEGPVIGPVTASPNSLWSPNHKMRDVTLTYSAADNCGSNTCIVSGVTSNEPVNGTGDGDTAPDWQIVSPTKVKLRAERAGAGTGRVYTITIRCTDIYGNHTFRTTTVAVPHDQ